MPAVLRPSCSAFVSRLQAPSARFKLIDFKLRVIDSELTCFIDRIEMQEPAADPFSPYPSAASAASSFRVPVTPLSELSPPSIRRNYQHTNPAPPFTSIRLLVNSVDSISGQTTLPPPFFFQLTKAEGCDPSGSNVTIMDEKYAVPGKFLFPDFNARLASFSRNEVKQVEVRGDLYITTPPGSDFCIIQAPKSTQVIVLDRPRAGKIGQRIGNPAYESIADLVNSSHSSPSSALAVPPVPTVTTSTFEPPMSSTATSKRQKLSPHESAEDGILLQRALRVMLQLEHSCPQMLKNLGGLQDAENPERATIESLKDRLRDFDPSRP